MARRQRPVSLRDFQHALARRLADAQASDTFSARLGVQVGKEFWLVKLDEAGEVVPVPTIAHVPLTQPWFKGLTNIRGNLFTVVDLAAFQGAEPTPMTPDTRLLLVGERYGMNTALLVNRMLGLRNVQQLEKQEGSDRAWEAVRYLDQDGKLWREMAMAALVYDNDFLQSAA